ncbi:MAG: DUF885 domain-containing protein [Pseudomonadota bacterium]
MAVGKVLKRLLAGAGALLLVAALGAYTLLWWRPLGVNQYINKITVQQMLQLPELITQVGAIENTVLDFHSDKLGSYTQEQEERSLASLLEMRRGLDRYGPEGLEGQDYWSWKIAAWFFDDLIKRAELAPFGYRVNQLSGVNIQLPAMLTDAHKIEGEKSIRRYVKRLHEFGRVIDETTQRVQDDREAGILPPDFIVDKTLVGLRAFADPAPAENLLVTSLDRRMADLDLSDEQMAAYLGDAAAAVESSVLPAYGRLIALFEDMRLETDSRAGIWRLPKGEAIYAAALRSFTTTDLTADEIHELGLAEIARIEAEMDAILIDEGLSEGTVAERIGILSADPTNLFSNDEEGRLEMIAYLEELDLALMDDIGNYFDTLPDDALEIVRVPVYAEQSSSTGYYVPAALDGSRPGRFFLNQRDTAELPRFALPTLMYHEGSPGHHFQSALGQKMEGVPFLRTVPLFAAHVEGWALYGERVVALDMGVYEDDPLGNLGRLQMELFRATRLAVDTGIHARRWSLQEAFDFLKAKTGLPDGRVEREVERYAANPGQATAYKTGQLAIIQMRKDAEAALGERFDLGAFHDAILMNGAMPLGILEELIDRWIADQLTETSKKEAS